MGIKLTKFTPRDHMSDEEYIAALEAIAKEAADEIERLRAAMVEIKNLETRDVHTGYDHGGCYIYEDYIPLLDVIRIIGSVTSGGK